MSEKKGTSLFDGTQAAMSRKSTHGGKREGARRPPIYGVAMERHEFRLRKKNDADVSDFEYLEAIGGSAAAGIRLLIDNDIADTKKKIKCGEL